MPCSEGGERNTPAVSVVIASYRSEDTLADCLRVLVPQVERVGGEVLVVDSGGPSAVEGVAAGFSRVRLIRSPERLFPGAARNRGVAEARSDVLAFLDADCLADEAWAENVVRLAAGPAAAFGGIVDCAHALRPLHWAAYFCSFHLWLPGVAESDRDDIPTCSLGMRRSTFERYGPFRETGWSSDTELNWRITAGGERIHLDPRLRVAHVARPTAGAFLRRAFQRGRGFAAMRVRIREIGPGLRVARALGGPLLPITSFARLVARAAGDRFPYRREMLLALPWVLLGFSAWAAGEMVGYVVGDSGDADRSRPSTTAQTTSSRSS